MKAHKSRLVWRALVEIGGVTLFSFAVLVMGKFTKSGGPGRTLLDALKDVFTLETTALAITCAIISCIVIEWLRKQNNRL